MSQEAINRAAGAPGPAGPTEVSYARLRGRSFSTLGAVLLLVRKSLRQHAFSTAITIGSVGLAAGLVMAVFAIQEQSEAAFTGGPVGFDAVLGARGSQLQLVLNTVFHLETSPGNIPWTLYQEIRRRPYVRLAIPYALGDNYHGYRIVGTSTELFTDFEYQQGRRFEVTPPGRVFDPNRMEAVIGSVVAERTGLKLGSAFNPYHGLEYDKQMRHEEEYSVVGVLRPTNSPSDRVIWIPIEGVYRMSGHVLRGTGADYRPSPAQEIPDEHKEVSAVMLKFRGPDAGMRLDLEVNRQGRIATLAWPIGAVMADLFDKIGWVNRVLQLVALLVVLVSGGTILAGVYNTISERRREFAILRALGARRRHVFAAIVCESAAIGLIGSILGYVVYAAILALAAVVVRAQTGVVLDWSELHWILWATPIGMTMVGALAGVVPAVKAYATDVASNLTPST
ncbi:MAG TPA: ABC transporter permease [Phycisphaerae bacterium]|nr:ABC transporter permease [Phycisphaerae bacterium]